jgi:hypothetical protein
MIRAMRSLTTYAIATVILICLASITQADTGPTYSAADAAKHVNEMATVRDVVINVHQSKKGNIFLNVGGRYPNQLFTGFVPSTSASNVPYPQQYEGKTVCISGKIVLYRGKPEIVVDSSSQLKIEH